MELPSEGSYADRQAQPNVAVVLMRNKSKPSFVNKEGLVFLLMNTGWNDIWKQEQLKGVLAHRGPGVTERAGESK